MGISEDLIVSSPIHEEFICGICQEVFLNPVLAEGCEHVFCKSCIEDWTSCAEGIGKATCPMDRQEITGLKALPRPFMNLYNSLKVRCKFHASGCVAVMTLGDTQDHPKVCELNPEIKKMCLNGCGAMLMRAEIEGHNCIGFLKSRIEGLEMNAQLNSDILRKEIEMLKLSQQNELVEQHRQMQYRKAKLFTKEHGSLNTKVKNLLMDYLNIKKPDLIKEEVKDLRVQVTQAKDTLKLFDVAPDQIEWLKETINKYEGLEHALQPMSPVIQHDVRGKYGGWIARYMQGADSKLSEIDQELSFKYGGVFISTAEYNYNCSHLLLVATIDEQLCRVVLSEAYQSQFNTPQYADWQYNSGNGYYRKGHYSGNGASGTQFIPGVGVNIFRM